MDKRFTRQALWLPLIGLPLCLLSFSSLAASDEEDDELAEVRLLTTPKSAISVGAGLSANGDSAVNRDASNRAADGQLQFNFDYNQRDDDNGEWTRARVQQFSLDSRLIRLEKTVQGSWELFVEYDQRETVAPLDIHSSLLTGSDGVLVTQGAASMDERGLQQERRNAALGARRFFNKDTHITANYRVRRAEGELFSSRAALTQRGMTLFYQPEPIDRVTHETELSINHQGKAWQLTGGYRLSLFENEVDEVTLNPRQIDSRLENLETATAPDNRSDTFFVKGAYQISPTTRAMLQFNHNRDRLQDDLLSDPINGRVLAFDGRVDRTLFSLSLSTHPTTALSINGRGYYRDHDERSDLDSYLAGGQTNRNYDHRKQGAEVDLRYRLNRATTLEAGIGSEHRSRQPSGDADMAWRRSNDEWQVFAGVRHRADPFSLAFKWIHADRDGSDWLSGKGVASGTATSNRDTHDYVASAQFADRIQNTWRLTGQWQINETWDAQLRLETRRSDYDGLELGLDKTRRDMAALDLNWIPSEEWQLSGWIALARIDQRGSSHGWQDLLLQTDYAQSYSDSEQNWRYEDIDRDLSFGTRIRGQINDEIKIGGEFSLSRTDAELDISALSAPANMAYAAGSVPDDRYRQLDLNLYAEYLLDDNRGVRVDYRYKQLKSDEWRWAAAADYPDTTVSSPDSTWDQLLVLTWFYRGW